MFFLIQRKLVSLPSFAALYTNDNVMGNGKGKSIKACGNGTLSALVPAAMLSKDDAQNSHGRRELTDYSCALTLTCVHDGHG